MPSKIPCMEVRKERFDKALERLRRTSENLHYFAISESGQNSIAEFEPSLTTVSNLETAEETVKEILKMLRKDLPKAKVEKPEEATAATEDGKPKAEDSRTERTEF